ncbi:hypothetical protein K456DRAFT_1583650 [Colletotrichum gloeosporioides 23]|nr:hypothetical protein K456DRAFT_1583650 [Colletotrichum gloeosporioides 23]
MQCCAGITEFKQYVSHYIESNRCYGRNSYNDRVPFVPRIVLDEFWTMERIENVLRSPTERIQAISHTIKSRYVAVFSILVFMSQPEHIPIFIQGGIEDSKLPLDTTPYAYSETSESLHVFDEFQKEQWKFCPLEFDAGDKLSNRHISPYHIVPVLEKTRINSRGAADEDDVSIYKVKLHPRCFHQTVFSGDDPETAKMYLNEVDMYSQLVRESAFDHIIRYYGSFETAGLRTIVLEHANGGSLKSFFLNNPPPHDQSNRKQFWNSLMGLLRGLENIHNLNETKGYSKGAWVLRGTHQDIKPQNILLCNTSFENMYDIKFKFVDTGTGNIRKMKNQGLDRDALDQAGNGMYSGPEACQDDGEARGIRGNSDIWSFGGIASEALVWCIWGEYGRSQYQTERFQATRETILKGGFHEGAFHDGDCLLDVVAERHRRTIAATGESEPWWSRLSDLILTRMLVPEPRDRATATELLHEWFGTPKLVSHYSDPIQPSTRPGTISSEQDYNPRLSRRSRVTVPNVHQKLNSVVQMEDGEEFDDCAQQPTAFQGLPLRILPPPGEESQCRPDTSGLISESIHQFGNSKYNYDGQSGPTDKLDPSLGRYLGDVATRKRAVSEGRVERPAPPERRAEGDNTSMVSGTTVVGEPGSYQLPPRSSLWQPKPPLAPTQQPEAGPSSARHHERKLSDHVTKFYSPPDFNQTGPHRPRPASSHRTFIQETATIDRVWTECLVRKEEERSYSKLMRTSSTWRLFRSFPQLKVAANKLRGTSGRDQIFLVDDSVSMIKHQTAIARACRVLCYILKIGNVDPDFFELHFTSGKDPVISTTSSRLQEVIEEMSFTDTACDMSLGLEPIASNVIDRSKPASIYVFTNGHWNTQEDEKFCFVDSEIGRLVNHRRKRGKPRNWVGVQFIRFFEHPETESDELGRLRLEALDDELKVNINDSDIVDTTNYDGDIYKMLLGAISPVVDRA